MRNPFLLVFFGGGVGSMLRLGVYRMARLWLPPELPWGTFAVNVAGSLLGGVIAGVLVARGAAAENSASLFLVTGLLGGFTTFSAFSVDALLLWQKGQGMIAAAYVAGTFVLALACAALGFTLSRSLFS